LRYLGEAASVWIPITDPVDVTSSAAVRGDSLSLSLSLFF